MTDLTYQLLVLDPSERKRRRANADSLLYLVRGFTNLWRSPKASEPDDPLTHGRSTLSVAAIEEANESAATASNDLGRAYILTLSGPYDEIESLREPLAAFLKDQEFEPLYVLRDQVSEQIACKLYPHLYRIENLLQGT